MAVPPPECPAHAHGAQAHGAQAPGGYAPGGPATAGLADLFGPENEQDPMGLYERLRAEHGPVAPVQLDGLKAWLLLGYRENLEVTRTPSRFSRDSRRWRDLIEGNVAQDSRLLPVVAWTPTCMFADGADHERLRGAVTESMARFDRRGVRRHIMRFTHQLVDQFSARGEAELVAEFAEHLPMMVLTHMIGMPEEHSARMVQASRDLIKGAETAVESNEFVTRAVRQLVARKKANPGRDLASWLLEHRSDLTDEEVVEHLRLVLLTGYETTANLVANTLRMVLTDRRFRASLAGGHMTLPDAVEHVLWNEPPLTVVPARFATGDTELGGQQIQQGDMLLLGLGAGNVDPAIRPDIEAPMLGNRSHLAFSGGPHECPGQEIGRAITDTGIDTLLMRLPDLHLSVDETELTWLASWVSRHLVELPVGFGPRRPQSADDPGLSAAPTPDGRLPQPAAVDHSASGPASGPASGAGAAAGNTAGAPVTVPGGGAGDASGEGRHRQAPNGRRPSLWKVLGEWLRGR